MIAMMSVSFFLLGLLVLTVIAFFVGLAGVIAVVTKRPGIVALVSLAILLLFGGVLVSLVGIRSVSHSNVHAPSGINVYPEVHHDYTIAHSESHDELPMPQVEDGTILIPPIMDASGKPWTGMPTIATPIDEFSSSSRTHYRADFAVWIFLLPIAAIVALIVAAVSRRKSGSSASGRGSWWPALLLVPVFAVLALSFLGYFGLRVTREFSGVPQMETLHHKLAMQQAAEQRAYAEATRAEEIGKSQMRLQIAEDKRQNDMAKAKQLQELQRIAAAMNVQLQRQFATMDINQLIAIFESPKIELSSTAEAPAAPEPPAVPAPPAAATAPAIPAVPVVTAPIVTVAEEKPNEVVETAKPQDKPAEVAADQTKKASVKKSDQPKADDNAAATAASELPTPIKKTEPLPDWVDDQPGMVGDDWREVIATDEYATAEEARRATDIYLMLKTAERIGTLAGNMAYDHHRPSITFSRDTIQLDGNVIHYGHSHQWNDVRLRLIREMGIGIDEIRRSVVREQHLTSRDSARALDTVYKQYTLAQFTPWFDAQLRRHWDKYRRSERFAMVGVGAGSVLGLLGFVFGLLKIDTWTKGYYTKRLFLGVPAAIIGGFAFFMLIAIVFE